MKINLGEKIRSLRKTAHMTQEQLADRLGMSCQAVSRWENGTTYPDLELLLPLAEIFGVTSDYLLGIPEEKKEREAKELFTELSKATNEKEINTEQIVGLIREIRLHHLKSQHFPDFWLSVKLSVYRMPEILPEVRITAETILEGDYSRWMKEEAIRFFSILESDEEIDVFLHRYASERDMSKIQLLYNRYSHQKWTQEHDLLRQDFLMGYIDHLTWDPALWQTHSPWEECSEEDYEILRRKNRLCLTLLHQFCNVIPDERHPVSGNGEVDFWVEVRIELGIEETCLLAQAGEYDQALLVLEDVVSLLEKTMEITAPVELGCASPWVRDIRWTAEESWGEPANYLPNLEEERMIRLLCRVNGSYECYCVYPSTYYHMLTDREPAGQAFHTRCLDSLWDNEEFRRLTDRVRALIVTRPVAEK